MHYDPPRWREYIAYYETVYTSFCGAPERRPVYRSYFA